MLLSVDQFLLKETAAQLSMPDAVHELFPIYQRENQFNPWPWQMVETQTLSDATWNSSVELTV